MTWPIWFYLKPTAAAFYCSLLWDGLIFGPKYSNHQLAVAPYLIYASPRDRHLEWSCAICIYRLLATFKMSSVHIVDVLLSCVLRFVVAIREPFLPNGCRSTSDVAFPLHFSYIYAFPLYRANSSGYVGYNRSSWIFVF